jgi:hypothetical protein
MSWAYEESVYQTARDNDVAWHRNPLPHIPLPGKPNIVKLFHFDLNEALSKLVIKPTPAPNPLGQWDSVMNKMNTRLEQEIKREKAAAEQAKKDAKQKAAWGRFLATPAKFDCSSEEEST